MQCYIRSLPVQVVVTFEQHSPGLQVGAATSEHCSPSAHSPLSIAHEYMQYGSPVSSHTLHSDPVGHGRIKQAMKIKMQSMFYVFHRYLIPGYEYIVMCQCIYK